MTSPVLRPCTEADRASLHELRDRTEQWLERAGHAEHLDARWSARAHDAIDRLLDQGRFVALSTNETVLAVAALRNPDMDFWTADDDLGSAWYVARMMAASPGQGHGSTLIEILAAAAAADGRSALRLDCMRTNTGLHAYYQARGFHLLRVVDHPVRRSGALFERRVTDLLPPPWDRPQVD